MKQEHPSVSRSKTSKTAQRVTFDLVLKKLRSSHFGVLSTVARDGRSHSVGVTYGVSASGRPLQIYVMTRTSTKKARNIIANPNVSFVIPFTRRLLTLLPPPCIEFQGKAEILDWKDEAGVQSFKAFFMGRRILSLYEDFYRRGERTVCFLRITPDPVIFTYMLGFSVWEVRRRMESGIQKVKISTDCRSTR